MVVLVNDFQQEPLLRFLIISTMCTNVLRSRGSPEVSGIREKGIIIFTPIAA